jgi:hypothetical protein
VARDQQMWKPFLRPIARLRIDLAQEPIGDPIPLRLIMR